jgi:alpha-mannosidase
LQTNLGRRRVLQRKFWGGKKERDSVPISLMMKRGEKNHHHHHHVINPSFLCFWLLFMLGWISRSSNSIGCNAQEEEEKFRFGARVYNTSSDAVSGKLNVHLVPHTHDDVGWLKTVDQYFIGSNNSIQVAAVQYVLDSVVAALQEDRNRKFIYVEQAFFQRWWREQTPRKQKIVQKLVKRGQLEFINGGYSMHDEAATHYVDMIDQTTLGHRYIKQQFGVTPRIGWQIDPFGHSAVQAYLLGAELGFDAFFFARADYQDLQKRRKDQTMEVIWQGSKSLGSSAQIFAGVLSHHYEPPSAFSFDIDSTNPPFQDDPRLSDYNVPELVDLFVEYVQNQSKEFRTNHLMWTMGDDFAYEYANTWFKQMDKLIHYVNLDGRVNALYSTPSIYLDAKYAANETWPLKTGDFFPYADKAHCYWTGYFTSRSSLKGYVRKLSGFLQVSSSKFDDVLCLHLVTIHLRFF